MVFRPSNLSPQVIVVAPRTRSVRALSSYPADYAVLLRTAVNAPEPLRVPLSSRQECTRLRQRLYEYYKALRDQDGAPDLVAYAAALRITIDGTALLLTRVDEDWDTSAIRSALGMTREAIAVATPTPRSVLMERLDTLRAKSALEKAK